MKGGIQKCRNIWQRNLVQREYLGDKNKNETLVFKWILRWQVVYHIPSRFKFTSVTGFCCNADEQIN